MNQPQRMAPVGTDKELSDLLDFSMVSGPTLPSPPLCTAPYRLPRKKASAKNAPSIWTSNLFG